MRLWSEVVERIRVLVFRSREERELDEELAFHLELEAERNVREGLEADEAQRRARLAFGGTERVKEEVRDARGVRWLEDTVQDARYGLRSLRRTAGFTATAMVILALGIGLATAVFTVAHTLFGRALPVTDQDRIIVLSAAVHGGDAGGYPASLETVRAFTRRSRSLRRVAFLAYPGVWTRVVRGADHTWELHYAPVSGDFFRVLGAKPMLGRALGPRDDVFGAAPALVLSYDAWRRRFGAVAAVVGRRLVMNDGSTYTIVGVMPRGLDYPKGVDAWVAVRALLPERSLARASYYMVGRLKRTVAPSAAARELTAYYQREGAGAAERKLGGAARLLSDVVVGDARPAVMVFAAAAALLLLITCINVANLLLVRGLSRAREIAVRTGLGAGRGRLTRQLLTEHVMLALAGGASGVAVAAVAVHGFVAFAPPAFPRLGEIRLDTAALLGAVGITTAALLMFGLAPALLTSRAEAHEILHSGTRQSATRRSLFITEALVVGQVALALLVLSAAALLVRSFVNLQRADVALEPSHLLVAELAFPAQYDSVSKQLAFLGQLVPAVEAMPGVRAASSTVAAPFSVGWDGSLVAEGESGTGAEAHPLLNMDVVTPGYFAALNLPILRGRGFTGADREGAARVVVVSRGAARAYWRGADPIGKRLLLGNGPDRQTLNVVGEVEDTRYRDLREARPSIYFPLRQSSFPYAPTRLVIRTSVEPASLVPTLRRLVAAMDPDVALPRVAPFDAYLRAPLARPRLNALLLAAFALVAVLLGAIGLFSVLATGVRRRKHELAIRVALGASTREVGWLVVRKGVRLTALGVIIGLSGAIAANRLLSGLLFRVSPTDTGTLAGIALLLLCVAGVASLIPTRWSSRVEPMEALRTE